MSDPQEVAKAFVTHFYQSFDNNAQSLAGLYNDTSMLTFEGDQFQGSQAIVAKLAQVGKCFHNVKSMDVQPSAAGNAIVIFVTGHVRIGDAQGNPLHFCELFQLVSTGPGAYYVHNDIFRLNYGL
ncbi:Nuclear transport factor [Seminavis robusta]|uniref:Nuclear transport factor 2 n=1 Tax=Seminavis robusta TaxID=568900 RepID=A0A9N8EJY0_9STRA|nr:Nuclear transport factor [Seminavis robusta]|eukprot:Sro1226_g254190.1 Nuclear transport factor (125) ;mRNA; f:12998-13499